MTTERSSSDWRPRSGANVARIRARMLGLARQYFADADVLEIDVPAIGDSAASDPNIDSVELRLTLDSTKPFFLHTSPEYAMKRLLADGYPDIYFLGKVFRDGEAGRRHQPEFTMVEWYRLGHTLDEIIDDTERFIRVVLDELNIEAAANQLSYHQAFRDSLGLDPMTASTAELAELAGADQALRDAIQEDRDAWLDLIMATKVAPGFATDRLTTIYHYPPSQAALARLTADGSLAERFEVYLGAVELANGYVELTDAGEQRQRFLDDREQRKRRGQAAQPIDECLLAAIEAGLPECAGVAAGFDRLLMLNAGCDDLPHVLTFPFE